jgi:hypothetical protein
LGIRVPRTCRTASPHRCSSLDGLTNRRLRWQPAPKLLSRPFSRTACRDARTYLYLKLDCFLPGNVRRCCCPMLLLLLLLLLLPRAASTAQ